MGGFLKALEKVGLVELDTSQEIIVDSLDNADADALIARELEALPAAARPLEAGSE